VAVIGWHGILTQVENIAFMGSSRKGRKMRKCIALSIALFAAFAPGKLTATEVFCDGMVCGGSGVTADGKREYAYDVTAIPPITDLYIGTDDGEIDNYRDICLPPKWHMSIERNRVPNSLDGLSIGHHCSAMNPHGGLSSATGTCGFVIHFHGPPSDQSWPPEPPSLSMYWRFGFNYVGGSEHITRPEDVGWAGFHKGQFIDRADWTRPINGSTLSNVGPVHGPKPADEHASQPDESGISTKGEPSAMWASELKALILQCIANNKASHEGNGKYTPGYRSMIFLMGQCYSGGFSCLTEIGDNIIVCAAAQADWKSLPVKSKMHYLEQLYREVKVERHQDWTVKKILSASTDNMNRRIREASHTPEPFFSKGGDQVTFEYPETAPLQGVLFAGVTTSHKRASTYAFVVMKNQMLKTLYRRDENEFIAKKPGTYAELKGAIEAAWENMNNNTQFIMVVADHGSRKSKAKKKNKNNRMGSEAFVDEGVLFSVPTEGYMVGRDVNEPILHIEAPFLGSPAAVFFNGHLVGTLPGSAVSDYEEFAIRPELLADVGAENEISINMADPMDIIGEVALSCGPVFGSSLADFEPDGDVDIYDYARISSAWKTEPNDSGWDSIYNLSGSSDNTIDFRDLVEFFGEWLTDTERIDFEE